MYIKRYSIAALLLIAATGWFVYGFVSKESLHVDVLGIMLPSLPSAVWVSLAMLLLYLATLFHMMFYSVVDSFRLRKYEKDYAHLLEAMSDAFLKKEGRRHHFKTDRYALLGEIADHTAMEPDTALETLGNEKLANVVKAIRQIRAGESVELKRYNLPPENPLAKANQINRYREGKLEDETILSRPEKYSAELAAVAFEHLVETAPLHVLEKYKQFMSHTALRTVLGRINADEQTLSVPNETLIAFTEQVEGLTPLDFLGLAKVVADHMLPEQRIKFFEMLSEANEKALDGYLLTLFDLEMHDKAKEILDATAADEYVLFKAFAELKECDKHYDINIFAAMMLHPYTPKG